MVLSDITNRIGQVPREVAIATMAKVGETATTSITTGCTTPTCGLARDYHQIQPVQRNEQARSRGRTGARYKPYPSMPNTRVLVHQLSVLASTGERPSPGQDISHLCHNSKCCNPTHLVIENHEVNMSRIGCLGTVKGRLNPEYFQRKRLNPIR